MKSLNVLSLCDGMSCGHDFDEARYLWKEERARLQGVYEDYIKNLTEKRIS